jgi:hypothetical protein
MEAPTTTPHAQGVRLVPPLTKASRSLALEIDKKMESKTVVRSLPWPTARVWVLEIERLPFFLFVAAALGLGNRREKTLVSLQRGLFIVCSFFLFDSQEMTQLPSYMRGRCDCRMIGLVDKRLGLNQIYMYIFF